MAKNKRHLLVILLFLLSMAFYTQGTAKILFSDNFSDNAEQWDVGSGDWVVENGEYVQKSTDTFLSSFVKEEVWDLDWTEYTFELQAKKLAGAEGFDIVFGIAEGNKVPVVKDDRGTMTFYDWNIAGWANTRGALRKRVNGASSNIVDTPVAATVETDKWYKIKIEVSPTKIMGYLDGELAFDQDEGPENGRVGFSLFGTSAAFDDIQVYDAGGPQAVSPKQKLTSCWGQIKLHK